MSINITNILHNMAQPVVEYWERTPQEQHNGERTVIITLDTLDALISTVAGSNELRAAVRDMRYYSPDWEQSVQAANTQTQEQAQ